MLSTSGDFGGSGARRCNVAPAACTGSAQSKFGVSMLARLRSPVRVPSSQ